MTTIAPSHVSGPDTFAAAPLVRRPMCACPAVCCCR